MQKQRLEQKNTFKLIPVQLQFLKIISLNAAEYEDYIKNEIEENEAIDSENKEDELLNDSAEFALNNRENFTYQKKELVNNMPLGVEESFLENVENQLSSLDLTQQEYEIAKYILGSLDNNGYLSRKAYELSDDLLFNENIDIKEQEIENIIKKIQSLEPPGIGAKDLRECLLLQLKRKKNTPLIEKTILILEKYYDLFANRKFESIATKAKISNDKELKDIIEIISKLNPKPLSSYQKDFTNRTITPDYILKIENGNELYLELNEKYIPALKISKDYQNMAEKYKENPNEETKKAFLYISQKIQGAKWLLDAITQRQKTLMKVGNFIVKYQKKYFLSGEEIDLEPLTQRELSNALNIDTSIISKLVNSKYIDTHFGIVFLRNLFSQKVSENLEDSSIKIKTLLKEIIDEENKKKPFSDEKIALIFKEKGYQIARRTIAKYREDLNIAPARLRRNVM